MADEKKPEVAPENMELETANNGTDSAAANGESNAVKRPREVGGGADDEEGNDVLSKKQKAEAETLEKELDGGDGNENPVRINLGPQSFRTSVEMFDYFCNLLHKWSPHLNVNKYEHMVLLELLKKGHPEPARKIGGGIQAFQVRNHPVFGSRCFFLIRQDDSADDFSFRKCVDHILPLPEHLKIRHNANKAGGGRRGGRGHGRGRKGRH